ncbi:MAG: hypothetical protein ACF8PN_14250 [Phycisphaerales bacterium]
MSAAQRPAHAVNPDPDREVSPERVIDFLRANTTGVLRYAGVIDRLKFVLDADGHLVSPVTPAMLDAADTVVFVPDEGFDALELLVSLEGIDGESAGTDRWRIYHGDPRPAGAFGRFIIEAGKFYEHVFDGDTLAEPNPFASDEPALCRWMNRERIDAVPALCREMAGVEVTAPVVVGVNSSGVDVRATLGIIHLPFQHPQPETGADARRRIEDRIAAAASRSRAGSDACES